MDGSGTLATLPPRCEGMSNLSGATESSFERETRELQFRRQGLWIFR